MPESRPHSNSPEAICCHEVAHAAVAWKLGYLISCFCVRAGHGVVLVNDDIPPDDEYAIACAGKLAELKLLGIEEPSGCGEDDRACRNLAKHSAAGEAVVEQLLRCQGAALQKAAAEIRKGAWSAIGRPGHLPGCPDPATVAEIVGRHWDEDRCPLPAALVQQRDADDD